MIGRRPKPDRQADPLVDFADSLAEVCADLVEVYAEAFRQLAASCYTAMAEALLSAAATDDLRSAEAHVAKLPRIHYANHLNDDPERGNHGDLH